MESRRSTYDRRVIKWRRPVAAAALASVPMLLAACQVAGTPQRGPLDVDTGEFVTTLSDPGSLPAADDPYQAGLRLADAVVFRQEVESIVDKPGPSDALGSTSQLDALGYFAPGIGQDTEARASEQRSSKDFRFGYRSISYTGTERSGDAAERSDRKHLSVAVLRYTDPEAAQAAVTELAEVADENAHTPGVEVKKGAAGLPNGGKGMLAVIDSTKFTEEIALVPRGRDVVVVQVAAQGDAAAERWRAETVRTAVDRQLARLEQDDVPDADAPRSADETDLLIRTVPLNAEASPVPGQNYISGTRAVAHLYFDAPGTEQALIEAGVDMVSIRATTVYRAADAAKAEGLQEYFDEFIAEADSSHVRTSSPQDLSSTSCWDTGEAAGAGSTRYYCLLAHDRYLIWVTANEDLTLAHQAVAAQYTLLDAE